ncbi:MAG: hypothetical protein QOG41_916 [Thermoleophilaceae bacterium]|nr:hypothetical protein [Thermoleophilaceae bacterium]
MLTRKITIFAATTALGVAAFAGTANADPKEFPGCRGGVTANAAQEAGGLGHLIDLGGSGQPLSPADFEANFVRDFCATD